MNNYWYIELYSGEIIKVRPDQPRIDYIQGLITRQEGAITTATRSIVVKDIKDFRLSDETYNDQKLIDDVSRAFNEPVFTKDGAIEAKWVKKSVTKRKWDTYYRFISSYKLISETDGHALIAFALPSHLINRLVVQDLTPDEVSLLRL